MESKVTNTEQRARELLGDPIRHITAQQKFYWEVDALHAVTALITRLDDVERERDALKAECEAQCETMNCQRDLMGKLQREWRAAEARCERLEGALQEIERAPAWGYPERWETTPSEVRQLARAALTEKDTEK